MADEKVVNQVEDEELNDLLDSALKDFNKEQQSDALELTADALELTADKDVVETSEDAWTKDFIKEAADQFEELQNIIKNGADNDLEASFQKLAQTIASAITDEDKNDKDSASTDFQSAIAQALNDLSTTSENLQSEADLSEMLGQASLEDGPSAILPVMQGMLQHLLSKEILYPSLKELVDKYPEWLEERKTRISSGDLQRFTKQLELMRQVCTELEKEKDDDTETIKKERFDLVMSLMQEVQGCGQLPEELIGDQAMPFQIDAESDNIMPVLRRGIEQSPQNCSLM